MNTLENLKNTWNKSKQKIAADKSLNPDFIKKAISNKSISITAALLKSIIAGIVFLSLDIIVFIYNIYFYAENMPVLISIIAILIISFLLVINMIVQYKKLKQIDSQILNLRDILFEKIGYFNKSFSRVIQSMALATAFLPFSVNLTMENSNGEFNISKIYLLLGFYILIYIVSLTLYRLTHSIYLKQLKNALKNLEENIFNEIEAEIRKSRKFSRIIGLCLLVITIVGIIFYYFFT